jgi:hypothetical protein
MVECCVLFEVRPEFLNIFRWATASKWRRYGDRGWIQTDSGIFFTLVLPEGRARIAWEPSNKMMLFLPYGFKGLNTLTWKKQVFEFVTFLDSTCQPASPSLFLLHLMFIPYFHFWTRVLYQISSWLFVGYCTACIAVALCLYKVHDRRRPAQEISVGCKGLYNISKKFWKLLIRRLPLYYLKRLLSLSVFNYDKLRTLFSLVSFLTMVTMFEQWV